MVIRAARVERLESDESQGEVDPAVAEVVTTGEIAFWRLLNA
jgi:hypothetical protein